VPAYNDCNSRWTWFKQLIAGGAFGMNNWPPLPAKVIVDDTESPVTRGMPKTFRRSRQGMVFVAAESAPGQRTSTCS
jgi:hypothetical protein